MSDDPHAAAERRQAMRQLVQEPLTCAEHDPEVFRLIRRHEVELDRWFTQRLGYRLHVDADTARLFKSGVLIERQPLRTESGRALHQLEHVLLALVLASTAAGPAVISLRDLVDQVRSAAAEAEIVLVGDSAERRALVAVLRWMIDHGLASELHAQVDAYATDDDADAVLRVRPDRIVLLALPALVGAADAGELVARSERRSTTRQWLRCRLVETPVIYRPDLTDDEWDELRRRLGDEERLLDEMLGLVVEARAEGVAAIDPSGALSHRRFPSTGTVGHAALLLVDELAYTESGSYHPYRAVVDAVSRLAEGHAAGWAGDLVASPERLTRQVLDLLIDHRLAEITEVVDIARDEHGDRRVVRILPGASRFRSVPRAAPDADPSEQETLW